MNMEPQNHDKQTLIPHQFEIPDDNIHCGGVEVVGALQDAGYQAFWVGGCVRNLFLGEALKDIDIATDATPEQVLAIFPKAALVGASFGVVMVRQRKCSYEVATFRSESGYGDCRRPDEVRFGTLEEDFRRRDFTVNAMYYDPVNEHLYDPAGGQEDLKAKRLRTVGKPEERFGEDALRLMRAVRFSHRYRLALSKATRAALITQLPLLIHISRERIRDELFAMLQAAAPGDAIRMMDGLGMLPQVLPEIDAMRGIEQPPQFHPEGDVFVHTCMVLEEAAAGWRELHGSTPPLDLVLGALFHDVGKPNTFTHTDRIRFHGHDRVGAQMVREIGTRLRWPRRLIESVATLVAMHMRFMHVREMRPATLRRFMATDDFEYHLLLHRADCLGSHAKLDNYDFCREQLALWAEESQSRPKLPPRLLNGYDLKALGLKPGPRFRELLDALTDEQLEGRICDRDQAMAWIRQKLGIQD